MYPDAFTASGRVALTLPANVQPDPIPLEFVSLGFDAISRCRPEILGFDCSPLSCNSMADQMPTNEHCLFSALEAAIAGAERFAREQPEPGSYFVVEVLEPQSTRGTKAPEAP
jgi:hypothetical protein